MDDFSIHLISGSTISPESVYWYGKTIVNNAVAKWIRRGMDLVRIHLVHFILLFIFLLDYGVSFEHWLHYLTLSGFGVYDF